MRSAGEIARGLGIDSATCARLGVLWGKSRKNAGGTMNLVVSHLFDTAAVAELIWDHFLASSTKSLVDQVAGGRGRVFFAWLCGIHDCGKATPAFQVLDPEGALRMRASGLSWSAAVKPRMGWRHDKAGARLLIDRLTEAGWSQGSIDWIWPLVGGHHGMFPSHRDISGRSSRGEGQGRGPEWVAVQRAVVAVFSRALGFADVATVEPVGTMTRAEQLHLSGLIVMADWIASDERFFTGVDDLDAVTMDDARGRAAKAWSELRVRGGWGTLTVGDGDLVHARFGRPARPFQTDVIEQARRMAAPGLLIIEAPMGEGKTEAALTAAEILAARFGADGVFVGMPTQATCDPMFSRVREWVAKVAPGLQDHVMLLHGKRDFNPEWKKMISPAENEDGDWFGGVGEDQYGISHDGCGCAGEDIDGAGPSEWLLGRLRGLLAPVVVGTIDQLLHAATRTRHVMLRMAGLVGKVVILDEVHAADVYMSQFLHEALRWLGQARVPVILLSATLPQHQRQELARAYLTGAGGGQGIEPVGSPGADGYPNIATAYVSDGKPHLQNTPSQGWRASRPVHIETLGEPEADNGHFDELTALLRQRLSDGGCALVIRNDVQRAQDTYQWLTEHIANVDVRLLHGRLAVEPRATRTQQCLQLLGAPHRDRPPRPHRMILVATQLAEQSFDVDADLLVSDLAPIDLLLQRIGRLHRHDRGRRPLSLRTPTAVITGFTVADGAAPEFLGSSEFIYGRHLLLRTADLVLRAEVDGWSVPADVPTLVDKVYSGTDETRTPWPKDELAAKTIWEDRETTRAETAANYLLSAPGQWSVPTLAGLHYAPVRGTQEQTELDALVRDGEESIEVVLLRHGTRGYSTYRGKRLGSHGELGPDLLEDVLAGTVRLPASLTSAALRELRPLPEWSRHPWLKHTLVLLLPDGGDPVSLGDRLVSYRRDLGLVVRRSEKGGWHG
ncbi:CRISPR-associated helicase Cas3' [Actinokineospora terrae]|uniref:CRISPR-associated endonuclease/helicase Cas3 n=1 Tax=Actinokineospora terrae TaxID=155974 RepID=A0A1H9MA28_9PSEU|nr:CRISPR-associated endonuclease/helicase Cas3 [Actinokineospora terrae]